MKCGLIYDGCLSQAETASVLPAAERFAKGPVAVIECIQDIPCNPCEKSCPHQAIIIGDNITAVPRLQADRCVGCGLCAAQCPGLAIFIVDASYSATEAVITLPYEYYPLPKEGDIVMGVSRSGAAVAKARVLKVRRETAAYGTILVSITVPKKFMHTIRSFRALREADKRIVCRCEEITETEIRLAVRQGANTVKDVKLATRAGMGACQGTSCRREISRIIAEETGASPEEILPPRFRMPVRPIPLAQLAAEEGKND